MKGFKMYRRGMSTIAVIIFCCSYFSAKAQTSLSKSRVTVLATDTSTNIWIHDFPVKTSIVISDNDQNLLTITTTNNYGAAFISLPTIVKSLITVKTVNGEVIATDKPVIKGEEQSIVTNKEESSYKA